MKRKIIILILISMISIFSFIGCKKTKTEFYLEKTGDTIGNYVIIKETEYKDPFGNHPTEYLVYDKNTKVMYTYTRSIYSLSLCPYYVTDEKGNPSVGVYNERIN